jgi:hypothetical protein
MAHVISERVCDQTTMGRPRRRRASQLLLQLLIFERDEVAFGVKAALHKAGRRTAGKTPI